MYERKASDNYTNDIKKDENINKEEKKIGKLKNLDIYERNENNVDENINK